MKISAIPKTAGVKCLIGSVTFLALCACQSTFPRGVMRSSHQQSTAELRSEPAASRANPATDVSHGRRLFLNNCAHCHGIDARGDEGPDLYEVDVSDRRVVEVITRGIPHEMPSFAKKLNATDVSELTAYVQSLGTQ